MSRSKMSRTNTNLRGKWTEEKLIKALEAADSEMTGLVLFIMFLGEF